MPGKRERTRSALPFASAISGVIRPGSSPLPRDLAKNAATEHRLDLTDAADKNVARSFLLSLHFRKDLGDDHLKDRVGRIVCVDGDPEFPLHPIGGSRNPVRPAKQRRRCFNCKRPFSFGAVDDFLELGAHLHCRERLLELGVLPNLVYRYYTMHGLAPGRFSAAIAASQ